jgi:ArsR family transcriptional regulator
MNYQLQAEICKTLASPLRLEILHRLAEGPTGVARLAGALGINQAHASQHLAVLRNAGVVEAERVGREVHYRLADPDVIVACDLMGAVLRRRLARLAALSGPFSVGTPIEPEMALSVSVPLGVTP